MTIEGFSSFPATLNQEFAINASHFDKRSSPNAFGAVITGALAKL